jgi:cyanophycinase
MARWLATVVCVAAFVAAPAHADENILGMAGTGLPAAGLPGKQSQGCLMVCGGGSLPNEIYDEFVRLAGGKSARLVLIPSAYPYESRERIEYRFSGWRDYKVVSFDFLDADTREKADTADFVKPLEEATGVWMSGGFQSRLSGLYAGTKVEEAIKRVLARGGVVSGTSAGAAAMSRVMIRYGTSQATVDRGLGLLDRAVVDQHFTERGRHTRLLGVIEQHPDLIGLGVDEGTALLVQGNRLKVMGRSRATVFVPREDSMTVLPILAGHTADLAVKTAGERTLIEVKRTP